MHPLVTLSKQMVESCTLNSAAPATDTLDSEFLSNRAGVFVSLKKHGQLRGCIGTISPVTDSVASEVLRNAVAAATQDPRFSPVQVDELSDITYSVDVLTTAEPVDDVAKLDPKRYGVIVSSGGRRGLLLPNLEGVNTAQEQIQISMQKAGIDPGEEISIERFEVIRYR